MPTHHTSTPEPNGEDKSSASQRVKSSFLSHMEQQREESPLDQAGEICEQDTNVPAELNADNFYRHLFSSGQQLRKNKLEERSPMPEDGILDEGQHLRDFFNALSDLPPAQAIAALEAAASQIEQKAKIVDLAFQTDFRRQHDGFQELQDMQKQDLTARGTPRVRRPRGSEKCLSLSASVPESLKKAFLQILKEKGESQSKGITQAIEIYINYNRS